MKLVTYIIRADELNIQMNESAGARLGWLADSYVVDAVFAQRWLEANRGISFPHSLPADILTLLTRGATELQMLKEVGRLLRNEDLPRLRVEGEPVAVLLSEVRLLAPVPMPTSVRDFYAFEQHVKTSRQRRGLEMIPEWYQIPVFYFSNHRSIVGPEAAVAKPSYTEWLDFELEVACVIGKKGKNIPADRALEYIAGFTIMNDWSARDMQRQEMKVGLGPAKGKDFATSLGPYLVTLDELEDRRTGHHWDLQMTAKVNGKPLSSGNMKDLYWSFPQMIERASLECELVPGDVIGSGTVGTGCILELGPEVHRWLQPGDVVELEIERLGVLSNRIVKSESSLLPK
ncbi:fumarylacetoacetate hydrolase family protein [Lihuaxuella thermophila]|uniref:2-keto-4-pentenoate hydratase/2-oxohepta-3-ene-1,7-dioic acid hydratase (Catechol pathway) n=1 Tax=Lihuaxuella thermophila TaxID=1173111 RepID=A0A1H8AEV3_9BACL|nr:2-keto-4-pentenoate hydratase/2-oxohepta-3-ene-1,7-dioic acid hydratase (catechol pathway) [Lihuaxuella thermophila]